MKKNNAASNEEITSALTTDGGKRDRPKWELQPLPIQGKLPPELRAEHARLQGILDEYLRQQVIKRLIDGIARRRGAIGFTSLGIVSLKPGEGRTFFSAVLARGLFRFFDAKVLLVDGGGTGAGQRILTAAGSLDSASEKAARKPTDGSCTVVCPIGDGSYFQDEFRIGELVRSIEDNFDFVIVDTQPLSATGTKGFDATSIVRQLDMSLALVGKTSAIPSELDELKGYLKSIGVPCLGCVAGPRE